MKIMDNENKSHSCVVRVKPVCLQVWIASVLAVDSQKGWEPVL